MVCLVGCVKAKKMEKCALLKFFFWENKLDVYMQINWNQWEFSFNKIAYYTNLCEILSQNVLFLCEQTTTNDSKVTSENEILWQYFCIASVVEVWCHLKDSIISSILCAKKEVTNDTFTQMNELWFVFFVNEHIVYCIFFLLWQNSHNHSVWA